MHAMAFKLKRAHLQTVTWASRLFEQRKIEEMPPARFDLLYLLRRESFARHPLGAEWGPPPPARTQKGLCLDLGLHRPTASEMLKRPDELGRSGRITRPAAT